MHACVPHMCMYTKIQFNLICNFSSFKNDFFKNQRDGNPSSFILEMTLRTWTQITKPVLVVGESKGEHLQFFLLLVIHGS